MRQRTRHDRRGCNPRAPIGPGRWVVRPLHTPDNCTHKMITIDSGIVLDFPATWERFTEGGRCVFHTPGREEVIISAQRLTGDGAPDERAMQLDRMVEAGLQAARRGAASPELRIVRPLAEDSEACALRCWTLVAETTARDVLFAQAVLRH